MTGAAPLLALGALAVLLGGIVASELVLPGPGDDDPAAQTGIRAAPRLPRLDSARATAQVVDHSDAWLATILARPLFSRDRRPPDAKLASAGPASETLPRLTGIAVSPLGRSAIFAGPSAGKPIVVGEGGSVGGYTVRSIAPGAVQLSGPSGARTLAPAFDASAPALAADAPRPGFGPGFAPGFAPGFQPFPAMPLQPGQPLQMPGRPFVPQPFVPQQPRFGDGAANLPGRFNGTTPAGTFASQP